MSGLDPVQWVNPQVCMMLIGQQSGLKQRYDPELLTQTRAHSLHDLNAHLDPHRNMKATIFHNNGHTSIIISDPNIAHEEFRKNHHLSIPQFQKK